LNGSNLLKIKHNSNQVSIITVTYNAVNFIEETIQSVLSQDYEYLEFLVIDGGSNDGTKEIIKRYENRINIFISEPDHGIYDAMNKGVAMVSGDWICFMNAGDRFYSKNTITEVAPFFASGAEILVGDLEIRYPNFNKLVRAGRPKNLWRGMQFSHQAMFIDSNYHKNNPYDLRYSIAADLCFCWNAFINRCNFVHLDQCVASVITGGVSEANRSETILQSGRIICNGKFKPLVIGYYIIKLLYVWFSNFLKMALPKKWVEIIINAK
jgi:glycosyltransferase involved in cell wall biosynthesis